MNREKSVDSNSYDGIPLASVSTNENKKISMESLIKSRTMRSERRIMKSDEEAFDYHVSSISKDLSRRLANNEMELPFIFPVSDWYSFEYVERLKIKVQEQLYKTIEGANHHTLVFHTLPRREDNYRIWVGPKEELTYRVWLLGCF